MGVDKQQLSASTVMSSFHVVSHLSSTASAALKGNMRRMKDVINAALLALKG